MLRGIRRQQPYGSLGPAATKAMSAPIGKRRRDERARRLGERGAVGKAPGAPLPGDLRRLSHVLCCCSTWVAAGFRAP